MCAHPAPSITSQALRDSSAPDAAAAEDSSAPDAAAAEDSSAPEPVKHIAQEEHVPSYQPTQPPTAPDGQATQAGGKAGVSAALRKVKVAGVAVEFAHLVAHYDPEQDTRMDELLLGRSIKADPKRALPPTVTRL